MSTTNKDKKKVKITIARDYYLTDNSRRFTQYPLVGDYYLTDYLDDISGKIFEGNTKKKLQIRLVCILCLKYLMLLE